jgi:hypothetical protein
MKDYKHEGEFIDEFSRAVFQVYKNLLEKYGIEDDDAVFSLSTGVYTMGDDGRTNLITSMFTTALDEEELSNVLNTSLEIYLDSTEEMENLPKEGTIEWWIKHFGNTGDLN